jgi:Zn-dependent M28 family amino/carboxypeptidase
MELAEAFGKAAAEGKRPRRSILFMTVTGEEKGLLGSEWYSNHPLFPLSNTVCDINTDMTGRYDDEHMGKPDYIYEIGSDKLSSSLREVLVEQNKKHVGLELDFRFNDPNDPNRFYYRSDHYNFAKHGIPVAFFFNGVHDDYHQPGDDVEKIEFDQVQKVGRLVFYMAWEISNREERLKVDSNKP